MVANDLAAQLQAIFEEIGLVDGDADRKPTAAQLEELGQLLANVAGRPARPWSGRYLLSLYNGTIQVGLDAQIRKAVAAFGAQLDGAPNAVLNKQPVEILAREGALKPGTVYDGMSVLCDRPGCPVHFIKRSPRQRYCTYKCRDLANKD